MSIVARPEHFPFRHRPFLFLPEDALEYKPSGRIYLRRLSGSEDALLARIISGSLSNINSSLTTAERDSVRRPLYVLEVEIMIS